MNILVWIGVIAGLAGAVLMVSTWVIPEQPYAENIMQKVHGLGVDPKVARRELRETASVCLVLVGLVALFAAICANGG